MSDRPPPESAQAWLRRAHSDLILGRTALDTPGVLLEDACFHAQQCVEKALKGLLAHRGIAFPRTHVLETLLDLLKSARVDLPLEVDESFVLTECPIGTRYPASGSGSPTRSPLRPESGSAGAGLGGSTD